MIKRADVDSDGQVSFNGKLASFIVLLKKNEDLEGLNHFSYFRITLKKRLTGIPKETHFFSSSLRPGPRVFKRKNGLF